MPSSAADLWQTFLDHIDSDGLDTAIALHSEALRVSDTQLRVLARAYLPSRAAIENYVSRRRQELALPSL